MLALTTVTTFEGMAVTVLQAVDASWVVDLRIRGVPMIGGKVVGLVWREDYSLLWSQYLVQGLSHHYIHFVLSPTTMVSPSNFFSVFPLALATVLFAMMYRPCVLVK